MLIKSCINCKYHEIAKESNEQTSHCSKENCYSRFSKCIVQKSLNRFLESESFRQNCSSSSCASKDQLQSPIANK